MTNAITIKISHQINTASTFSLDVDTVIPSDKVTVIFGHSGSGKTTLLRCIAGLETRAQGDIRFNEECWQSASQIIPTHKRSIGYVFQEASLFSHLTVQGNLDYASKRARHTQSPVSAKELIHLLGIEPLLSRPSTSLSGGERQRVAIARALLTHPKLLLMDEPLAALDYQRKQEILPYLDRLKHELAIPIIYVTHAMDEVTRLADHLVVLESGQIKQQGSLQSCLHSIDNPIALTDELSVIVEGKVSAVDSSYQRASIPIAGTSLWFQTNRHRRDDAVRIRILARDISLTLSAHTDSSINNILPAKVASYRIIKDGAYALIQLKVGTETLISKITVHSFDKMGIKKGLNLWVQIKAVALVR